MNENGPRHDIEHDADGHQDSDASSTTASTGDQGAAPNAYTPLLAYRSAVTGEHPACRHKQISPYRLMLPFFIYCLAVGAVAVPKINVILALLCINRKQGNIDMERKSITSDDICTDPVVHAQMGRFVGYCNLLSGTLCAISSPRLGRWSDRYGRKPFLALSALGMFSGDAVSVVAAWFPQSISVYWILLEFVIGGLTGAFLTTLSLIQTYTTDITLPETRASAFSLLHACMYLGLALGPVAGAFLIRNIGKGDILYAFYVAGVCHALFIAYVLIGIPESLPTPSRTHVQISPKPPPSKLKARGLLWLWKVIPLSIFGSSQTTSPSTRKNLPILATIDAISFGVQIGLPPLLVLYSEYQLHWENFEASIFFSAINITRTTILALILPAAINLLTAFSPSSTTSSSASASSSSATPPHQRNPLGVNIAIIRLSLLLACLSNLGFALSKHSIPFTLSGVLSAAGAPVSALAQSAMTTYVTTDRVGELFGTLSFFHAVSRALMPAAMYFVYSLTLQNAPTALFWGLGALSAATFLAAFTVDSKTRNVEIL